MTYDEPASAEEDDPVIAAFMRHIAAAPLPHNKVFPSAEEMLRRTHWSRRWEGERRMHLPLDVVGPLQVAAGLAAIGILVYRALPVLAVTLQRLP